MEPITDRMIRGGGRDEGACAQKWRKQNHKGLRSQQSQAR